MPDIPTPTLEGEILQRRYAIVEVTSAHGDWIRCRVYDMQQMAQRDAVVQISPVGEHEVQLLPAQEAPPAPPPPAPTLATPPAPEFPPPAVEPPTTPVAEEPLLRREDLASGTGDPARPGQLEAAWFAVGAETAKISEEDRPAPDDGDLLIAPSRVQQVANELTTKTYMRYRVDTSNPRLPAVPGRVSLPGRGRLWVMLAVAGGVLATLTWMLLR